MFSATDIASFLACPHTATLDRAESKDEIVKPFFKDAAVDLLRKLGLEHEQRYLRELAEKDGHAIAHITLSGRWEDAVAQTVRALHEGVDAVYQATFLDGPWGGRSDFLVRVNKPSALGVVVLRGCGHQARTLHQGDRAGSALLLFGLAVADSGCGATVDARCVGGHGYPRTIPSSTLHRLFPQGEK